MDDPYDIDKAFGKWHEKNLNINPLLLNAEQSTTSTTIKSLKKLHLLSKSNNSIVWKAWLNNESYVSLKIYYKKNHILWNNEINIFKTLDHSSVIKFLCHDEYKNELTQEIEYRLITQYHEYGSLQDYLNLNILSLHDCLVLLTTLVNGVVYLHTERYDEKNMLIKPMIAHRDIKSANVLIKHDKTACLTDFGVALNLSQKILSRNDFVQIGTIRYMAPELLVGVISHTRESLLKVDVYAIALVFWEILSRCEEYPCNNKKYLSPFDEYINEQRITLETMYDLVIGAKKRPIIIRTSIKNQILHQIFDVIEEAWDQEPDTRLTAHSLAVKFQLFLSQVSSL
ncbi:unnamed protein product [Didymodactylos carnosus]|uniref:receptor protein serine/threonine kinase n=1 Tax=Didymodactylos carnosus TaxID=1234261 RepID=A0A8S2CQR6_9BILA|nr:unnamed protein product [Didymodactylos carnosus]CAF3495915.1 unnamed protein product [Didymodactylos carnosus]